MNQINRSVQSKTQSANSLPTISLLIVTYNRPQWIDRAINSILEQTFQDFEIIIINNGSGPATYDALKKYEDHPKIRTYHLKENRMYAGGFNYGLDKVRGEWFCELSDDDFLYPNCFETLLSVPNKIDKKIDAVTCNGHDTATDDFSGTGFSQSQFLPVKEIVQKAGGDFWGITKSNLIGDKRLNEKIRGLENTFWYQIDEIANRYYLHEKLMTYCMDHGMNETTQQKKEKNPKAKADFYNGLLEESPYWRILRENDQAQYFNKCLKGFFFQKINGNQDGMNGYKNLIRVGRSNWKIKTLILAINILPSSLLRSFFIHSK